MDYKPLMEAAKKRQGWTTDYELAKQLGYTSISDIYKVRKGKLGMRPERLMKLLNLAGKTLAGVTTISALLCGSADVRAMDNHAQQRADIYIMRIYDAGN